MTQLKTTFKYNPFHKEWDMLVEHKEEKHMYGFPVLFPHNCRAAMFGRDDIGRVLTEQILIFTVVMDPAENQASYFRPVYSLEALAHTSLEGESDATN
jgi:hypothetical protein